MDDEAMETDGRKMEEEEKERKERRGERERRKDGGSSRDLSSEAVCIAADESQSVELCMLDAGEWSKQRAGKKACLSNSSGLYVCT